MVGINRECGRALESCGPMTGEAGDVAIASRLDADSTRGVPRAMVRAETAGTVLTMAVPGRSESTVSFLIYYTLRLNVQARGKSSERGDKAVLAGLGGVPPGMTVKRLGLFCRSEIVTRPARRVWGLQPGSCSCQRLPPVTIVLRFHGLT